MAASSKEDMLAVSRVGPVEVELPSGLVVEVRSITLEELRKAMDSIGDGEPTATVYLSAGLVAPELTEQELIAWVASAPAGDPMTAMRKIEELSGLAEGAPKATYKSVRGRSKS